MESKIRSTYPCLGVFLGDTRDSTSTVAPLLELRGFLQGVVDGQVEILVLGMLRRIARDYDLFTGHCQPNANVVEVPFVMMVVGSFHDDWTGLDLVEELLELARSSTAWWRASVGSRPRKVIWSGCPPVPWGSFGGDSGFCRVPLERSKL